MSQISVYLLSVVGVVFLLVFIELVLPESKISKYIKSIFSIFVIVVIITPIVKLVKNDWDWNSVFTDVSYDLNQTFLDDIKTQKIATLERELGKIISKQYQGAKVSISAFFNEDNMEISYIFVDLSDLVIKENEQHKYYYTTVKELVRSQVKIDEERVIVYG